MIYAGDLFRFFSFPIPARRSVRNENIEEIHATVSQGIGLNSIFKAIGKAENSPGHGQYARMRRVSSGSTAMGMSCEIAVPLNTVATLRQKFGRCPGDKKSGMNLFKVQGVKRKEQDAASGYLGPNEVTNFYHGEFLEFWNT